MQDQCLGKLGGSLPSKSGMGAVGVIDFARVGQRCAGKVQARAQGLVQQLIVWATVEAFVEGILGRLAGCYVVPVKLAII